MAHHHRNLLAGEMSPEELENSVGLHLDRENHGTTQDDREEVSDEQYQSSAPRTFDRMIKSNLPTYSPLTVSR